MWGSVVDFRSQKGVREQYVWGTLLYKTLTLLVVE
jgi:hypothetical protein